jgi:hypothetical protein
VCRYSPELEILAIARRDGSENLFEQDTKELY